MVSMSTLLPALLALIGGGLLSLLIARIFGVVFGRLTRKTRSETDDFIVQVIVATIPILGWVVSASWAWWLVPTPPEADRVVFSIAKLILVVFLVRLLNRISLRLLQRSAIHSGDPAVGSMLRALAPMFWR